MRDSSYLVPRWRIAYVRTPKAACTSLKWLIADLNGEDPEAFRSSTSPEVTRATTIHRRALWRNTPSLYGLADDELTAVTPADWFIFAVVRHPATRLWSAWQSKFLLRESLYMRIYSRAPWLPRVPVTTADLVEDFERLVLALPRESDHSPLNDRHFRPQVRLLTPESTPYSKVYRTEQMPQLLEDLRTHLEAHGGPPLPTLRSSNDTPLRPLARLFTDRVVSVIEELYKDDLATFGFDSAVPDRLLDAAEYGPAELHEVAQLIERNERIGDLATTAKRLQKENKELRAEVQQLRSRQSGRRRLGAGRRSVT